jgi:hypothetical protein
MSHARHVSVLAAAVLVTSSLLVGCGSSGTKLTAPTRTSTSAAAPPASAHSVPLQIAANYHPKIDPSRFTNHVTNRYFPLRPGTTLHYRGVRDGVPTEHTFKITRQTKVVMGVPCAVISDVVTQNGSLVEKTTDWYAQDDAGNVWYFGEDTAEYQNGVVTTTAGTWEAGVDNAKPGIVMPAHPKVGQSFRQEYRPGVALDQARILSVNSTASVPAGTYHHLIVTFDKNPLDPSKKERKWFAPGVGFIRAVLKGGGHFETTEYVKRTTGLRSRPGGCTRSTARSRSRRWRCAAPSSSSIAAPGRASWARRVAARAR